MASEWHKIDDQLPAPGEQVIRYGQSIFGPYMDVGELLATNGARWIDWGVTHWRAYQPGEDIRVAGTTTPLLPDEWLYIFDCAGRCADTACQHLAAFHVDDGPVGCLITNCRCRGWQT